MVEQVLKQSFGAYFPRFSTAMIDKPNITLKHIKNQKQLLLQGFQGEKTKIRSRDKFCFYMKMSLSVGTNLTFT